MKIDGQQTAQAVLEELGARLTRRRIQLELTQAQAAAQAGIGKRTLERVEAGADTQLSSFLGLLRALDLLAGLEQLVPEPGLSPVQLVKLRGKERRRARGTSATLPDPGWRWGDER